MITKCSVHWSRDSKLNSKVVQSTEKDWTGRDWTVNIKQISKTKNTISNTIYRRNWTRRNITQANKTRNTTEPRSTHIQAGGEWQQIEEGADSYPSLETTACNYTLSSYSNQDLLVIVCSLGSCDPFCRTHLGSWTGPAPTGRAKHKLASRPLWGSGWHRCACRAPWCCTTWCCWCGCWASYIGTRWIGVPGRFPIQPSPCPSEKIDLWLFDRRSTSWNS